MVENTPGAGRALTLRLPPVGGAGGDGRTAVAELRARLDACLGREIEVRRLGSAAGRWLELEIAGRRVLAEGFLPPDTPEIFRARLAALEPRIELRLPGGEENAALPPVLRRALAGLLQPGSRPAEQLAFITRFLAAARETAATSLLPRADLRLLRRLHRLFAGERLLANLASGRGGPHAGLGLELEAALAAELAGREGQGGSVSRLLEEAAIGARGLIERLLVRLPETDVLPDLPAAVSGEEETRSLGRLRDHLRGLRGTLELNQLLNNPGLNPDGELKLILPFWGPGGSAELWLRIAAGHEAAGGRRCYSLMLYLDFAALGPVAARVVATPGDRLEAELLVVSESAAAVLKEELPAARSRLGGRFPGGVRLFVNRVGPEMVAEFRHRCWLARLPPLFSTAG